MKKMTTHFDPYANIKTETHYRLLLASGMFWEIYPELTGDWDKDKEIIHGKAKQ